MLFNVPKQIAFNSQFHVDVSIPWRLMGKEIKGVSFSPR